MPQTGEESGEDVQIIPPQVSKATSKRNVAYFKRNVEIRVLQTGGEIVEVVQIIPPEVLKPMPQARTSESVDDWVGTTEEDIAEVVRIVPLELCRR